MSAAPPDRVRVVVGDIVDQQVDAIVNAANRELAAGAGVCGAIFQAAGATEMTAACRAVAPCPTGEARTTPGFALAAAWVVHAVGPSWSGGGHGEEVLLRSAYRAALAEAVRVEARSIAFPVLSTGVYGYPLDDGCRAAWEELSNAPASLDDVRIVAFGESTAAAFARLGATVEAGPD
jgi:O-acetyl-ADP-ribose deacetylase (regulator of RNase III)